jgi:phosphoribosylglycinamide formyltransferase 1
MARVPVAILISGSGSNMAALIAAARQADYPAEIRLVLSNRPDAAGLAVAAEAGIATGTVESRAIAREAFEAQVTQRLEAAGIELVCLAGFMRLLTPGFVARWRDRLINIHPSLLPAFKGLDTHQRALAAGVRVAGCTVHFVRAEMDHGPIIAQAAVPVSPGDIAQSLAARVLEAEHVVYPMALALVASGRARVDGERVVIENEPPLPAAMIVPGDRT